MSAVLILVHWSDSQEVLKIDFRKIERGVQLTETNETGVVDGVRGFWRYNTSSTRQCNDDGTVTLTVHYRSKDNAHLRGYGCRWGNAIVELNPRMQEGRSSGLTTTSNATSVVEKSTAAKRNGSA